jgi:predicted nucleic acid-binding protein
MSLYVVDSSVAIKWYVPEKHSEAAAGLLDDGHALCAPDLLPAEFGNVLWKKHRRGELTGEEVRTIVRALPLVPLHVYSSLELLEGAIEVALQTTRSVYDSVYVALALALGGTLITADARLVNALRESTLAAHVMHIRDL